MASYAGLLSLMHTLNQIKKHPRPPISLDRSQVYSLTQNLTFLQDFLERYSSNDDLESRIAAAAHTAEDIIESHIVDRIHAGSNISTVDLSQGLERVIHDMDLIKNEVMVIIREKSMGAQHKYSSVSTSLGRPASTWQNNTVEDLDDVLTTDVLDKLIGQQCHLQIIPIVGMGGIGKTTLARNIYLNPLIAQHFDILVWVTISREYSVPEILSQVLSQEIKGREMSIIELGERVHKKLWGRRYLIVMDDIWSAEPWDKVKSSFPNGNNGSRVMITTRISNLALDLNGSQVFQMNFLDEDKSWNLLCKIVFGKAIDCPKELEHTGKKIARSCRGLPLSIVVIGGLLTRSNMTRTYWEYILENLSSHINLEKDEYCLQILRSSYKELPVHLKPCFLYMGIFTEDGVIHVPTLVNLWVSEGILGPTLDKSLEEVGEEYMKELIDRNLIFVYELRWNGKARLCKIHDLLRDLCLREAQKERFLCVLKHQRDLKIPHCMNMERRICIHDNTGEQYSPQFLHALKSASLARSLILMSNWQGLLSSLIFKLLRVYTDADEYSYLGSVAAIFQNANLRCINIDLNLDGFSRIPSSWFPLWNLQTLKLDRPLSSKPLIAPPEIWEMPLLRHVMVRHLQLPDPLCGESDLIILEDLQTLSHISNFKCSEAVIKRIPNLKKLRLKYQLSPGYIDYRDFCLHNFVHLKELQSLSLQIFDTAIFFRDIFGYWVQNLGFPHSLKKLTLGGTMLDWEECATMIGSLPLLQFLSLDRDAFWGTEWETVEDQFCCLKFLRIYSCNCLKHWRTDSTHFPRLERLVLQYISNLEEIPSSIGDIPTLESIELENCSTSVADSAKRIKEEQAELGNIDLQVHIGFIMSELLQ